MSESVTSHTKTVANRAGRSHSGTADWQCAAQVPSVKGDKRVTCSHVNSADAARCGACGATKNTTTNQSKDEKMSNPTTQNVKPSTTKPATASAAPAQTAQSTKSASAAPAATADAAKTETPKDERKTDPSDPSSYKGLPRLKFYSTAPGKEEYCARVLPIFVEKYGAPKDPWGNEMKLRAKDAGPSKKVQRIEAKEAEEKRLATMSDEEKLAYAKAKRESRAAEKAAKQKATKEKLMAELRAELEKEGMAITKKS